MPNDLPSAEDLKADIEAHFGPAGAAVFQALHDHLVEAFKGRRIGVDATPNQIRESLLQISEDLLKEVITPS